MTTTKSEFILLEDVSSGFPQDMALYIKTLQGRGYKISNIVLDEKVFGIELIKEEEIENPRY